MTPSLHETLIAGSSARLFRPANDNWLDPRPPGLRARLPAGAVQSQASAPRKRSCEVLYATQVW